MKKVVIGAGQGFYGDNPFPAYELALNEDIDYLCFDALAELTLAILAKDRQKSPEFGYTKDLKAYLQLLLPVVAKKRFKLITNAGGLNPQKAAQEIQSAGVKFGLKGIKIAVVEGDDFIQRLDSLNQKRILRDLSGEPGELTNKDKIYFANAYLGAKPIVEALKTGADVVVTGRVTDSSLFLAPLIHEFGWTWDDYDRLAQGIVLGHLMECSGQATGGNFSGAWQELDLANIGYPVAEALEDGSFVLGKPKKSGGLVSRETVSEQLLYEIQDPFAYVTPEVVVDLSSIALTDLGDNRVEVKGAKGKQPGGYYKFITGQPNGYLAQISFGYCWPDAYLKAERAVGILKKQLEQYKVAYDELRVDMLGQNSLHLGLAAKRIADPEEVVLRLALKTESREAAQTFLRLLPPLALNGPPGMGGFSGIPSPRELVKIESYLIPKAYVEEGIKISAWEVE